MIENLILRNESTDDNLEVDIRFNELPLGSYGIVDYGTRGTKFTIEANANYQQAGRGVIDIAGERFFNPGGAMSFAGDKKLGFFTNSSVLTVEYMLRSTDAAIDRTLVATGTYPANSDVRSGFTVGTDQFPTNHMQLFVTHSNKTYKRYMVPSGDSRRNDVLRKHSFYFDKSTNKVWFVDDTLGFTSNVDSTPVLYETYFRLFGTHYATNGTGCASVAFKRLTFRYL